MLEGLGIPHAGTSSSPLVIGNDDPGHLSAKDRLRMEPFDSSISVTGIFSGKTKANISTKQESSCQPREARTPEGPKSFTTTAKGVINAGDIVRKTSVNSLMSSGSAVPLEERQEAPLSAGAADVVIQGDEGVGKTALTRQFSSSEYMGTYNNATSTDGDMTETTIVPVLLDGEESVMEFIDGADAYQIDDVHVDAYIVVFSIVDRNSFVVASDLARQLRVNMGTDRAIILVGNKSDLVRKRQVNTEDARQVATTYDCKYTETSAALNHQVDELVAGTLAQIRHQLLPPVHELAPPPPMKTRSRTPSPVSFFHRLFKRNPKGSASCEGIFMQ
ncbi:GTP-binding protein REM 1-like [Aplysia californica]|uniref:GTP-binding protein REM 1-like n=1 Tax=Aplysia californica TaxID=6500 RepID=A0ABM1A6L3_APLCA|nr:GTP-binding protein REM 1-like [Aplysia californica]